MSAAGRCRRFETEGALSLERGEPLDPHFKACPDCIKAHEAYVRIAGLISLAPRARSEGWFARVRLQIQRRRLEKSRPSRLPER